MNKTQLDKTLATIKNYVDTTKAPKSHTHNSLKQFVSRPTSANLTVTGDNTFSHFKSTSTMTEGKPTAGDGHVMHFEWDSTGGWSSQVYVPNRSSSNMQFRGMNAGTWDDWVTLAKTTDNVASATKLQTARTLTIGSKGKTFDGGANVSWSLSEIGALPLAGGTLTGATTFNDYLKLNAWTNYGTGTADFWYDGTNKTVEIENATNLKLAGTKVSKEGHTHNYLPLSGGTLTGATIFNDYLKLNAWSGHGSGTANFWYDGTNKTVEIETATDLKLNGTKVSKSGHNHKSFECYGSNTITSTTNDTTAKWSALKNSVHWYSTAGQLTGQPGQYGILCNFTNGSSEVHQLWLTQASGSILHRGGNASNWSGSWRTILDSSNYSSYALPLSGGTLTGETTFNDYLKLNAWSGHGSGTANFWYDGTNKTVEIETATDLKLNGTKVSKSGHTHDSTYLKLSGGTLTGETTFNNYLKLNAWSGYGSGTADFWYDGTNKTVEIETATNLKLAGTKVSKEGHNHDSTYLKLSGGTVTGTSTFSGTLNLTGNVNLGGNGGNLYFANNKGIALKNTGGTDRWVLYMDQSNRVLVGNTNQATHLQGSSISLSGTSAIVLNLTDTNAEVGYDSGTGDTYLSNKNGNWLRMRADGTGAISGKQIVTFASSNPDHTQIRYGSGLGGQAGYITFSW